MAGKQKQENSYSNWFQIKKMKMCLRNKKNGAQDKKIDQSLIKYVQKRRAIPN